MGPPGEGPIRRPRIVTLDPAAPRHVTYIFPLSLAGDLRNDGMALAQSNAQGEFSPLEIGIHALRWCHGERVAVPRDLLVGILERIQQFGVTLDNFLDYLAAGAFGVGFTADLFRPQDIAAERYDAVRRRAADVFTRLN